MGLQAFAKARKLLRITDAWYIKYIIPKFREVCRNTSFLSKLGQPVSSPKNTALGYELCFYLLVLTNLNKTEIPLDRMELSTNGYGISSSIKIIWLIGFEKRHNGNLSLTLNL